jgi:hypothetical protein
MKERLIEEKYSGFLMEYKIYRYARHIRETVKKATISKFLCHHTTTNQTTMHITASGEEE